MVSPGLGAIDCACGLIGENDSIDKSVIPLGSDKKIFSMKPAACTACNLLVEGTVYNIALRGTADGAVGEARVELVINQGPTSGSCEACRAQTGGTFATPCRPSGRALLDEFTMACYAWSDEDTPLVYQFGQVNSDSGATDWFDIVPDSFKSFKLPSGSVTLVARIYDNLGASSKVEQSTLDVGLMSGRRRLLATVAEFNEVQVSVSESSQLGRSDLVNQLSTATAAELDAASLPHADQVSQKKLLIQAVDSTKGLAAQTSGLAGEVSVTSAALTKKPCALDSVSVMKVIETTQWTAGTLYSKSEQATPVQTAENILKTVDGTTKSTQSDWSKVCAPGPVEFGADELKTFTENTRDALFKTMLSAVSDQSNGEAPLTIVPAVSEAGTMATAVISDLATMQSNDFSIGDTSFRRSAAKGAAFTLPSTLSTALQKEASTMFSIVQTQPMTPSQHRAHSSSAHASSTRVLAIKQCTR